jgi:hypothetical protein
MRWLLLLAPLALSCGSPYELRCEDTVAPEQATFREIRELVVEKNATSCSRCHNARTPIVSLNFETSGAAFDGLLTRRSAVYEQIASGHMPLNGPAWSEEQVRVLRSWYCQGAPYAP